MGFSYRPYYLAVTCLFQMRLLGITCHIMNSSHSARSHTTPLIRTSISATNHVIRFNSQHRSLPNVKNAEILNQKMKHS